MSFMSSFHRLDSQLSEKVIASSYECYSTRSIKVRSALECKSRKRSLEIKVNILVCLCFRFFHPKKHQQLVPTLVEAGTDVKCLIINLSIHHFTRPTNQNVHVSLFIEYRFTTWNKVLCAHRSCKQLNHLDAPRNLIAGIEFKWKPFYTSNGHITPTFQSLNWRMLRPESGEPLMQIARRKKLIIKSDIDDVFIKLNGLDLNFFFA